MIFTKLWERYFLKEFCKIFCFFLCSFFFLYILIDYSIHAKYFARSDASFFALLQYYLCHFSKRLEVLLPFASMLATIKVLTSFNTNNELIALRAGGISLKMLSRPFLILSLLFTLFIYLNFEYIAPSSLGTLQLFEDYFFNDSPVSKKSGEIYKIPLEDNSSVIYHSYNSSTKEFQNAFWFISIDEMYHFSTLHLHADTPYGQDATFFSRNENGLLLKRDFVPHKVLTEMHIDAEALDEVITPYQYKAISRLWRCLSFSEENLNALASFYLKCALPLACLFAVIGPLPFCLRFNRNVPLFLIYFLGIFSVIAFFTLINACFVLGTNGVLPPFIVIWAPIAICGCFCSWNFIRMR